MQASRTKPRRLLTLTLREMGEQASSAGTRRLPDLIPAAKPGHLPGGPSPPWLLSPPTDGKNAIFPLCTRRNLREAGGPSRLSDDL